jgi:hypothetical protein
MTRERVLAVGGERSVPAPDPIARDYLLLALRLDQADAGLVDGYFGPADLKATVDLEQPRSAARLLEDATSLRRRVAEEVVETDRRDWLDAQLVALEIRAAILGGASPDYLDEVERSFAWRPSARPEASFDAAAVALDAALPGDGTLAERLATWDSSITIPVDRVETVVEAVLAVLRERAVPRFGVPDGDGLTVGLVSGQPWTGYNWYDGGLRSRVDLNTDLPIRLPELVDTLAHETYAGHHIEHAWKEASLVEAGGRLEASVLMLLTPECLISEGLADLGPALLLAGDARADLLAEVARTAGLVADAAGGRTLAERALAIREPRRRLAEVAVNAALLRWSEGASSDETLAYLRSAGRLPEERARKRLEFIEHPRWRTYVHVYYEGEPLLRSWVDAAPDGDREARFRRLLRESLTPGAISAELAALGATEPG